jgi:hypothetical protein
MKFIKKLVLWFIGLFTRNKLKVTNYKTKDVIKPIKIVKTREERLKLFKERFKENNRKRYPLFFTTTYSRAYTRFMMTKEQNAYKHALFLRGMKVDEDGNEVKAQKPYTKSGYRTLEDYMKYQKMYNYKSKQ